MSGKDCELFELLRVVGEKEVQIVERGMTPVPPCTPPAKKILHVLVNPIASDVVFIDKVVKQGVFHVEIIFVACDDTVHHASLDIPFMAEVDIPGARQGMHVQECVIRLEQHTTIAVHDSHQNEHCQVFEVLVVAHFLIKVKEEVQRRLPECRTSVQCFEFRGCSAITFERRCIKESH